MSFYNLPSVMQSLFCGHLPHWGIFLAHFFKYFVFNKESRPYLFSLHSLHKSLDASLRISDTLPLVPSSTFTDNTSKARQNKTKWPPMMNLRPTHVTLVELAPGRLNRISQFKYKFISLHRILKVYISMNKKD